TRPDSGPFHAALRHFFLKYVSIPAKKCLAQRENSSLPVTSPVFRYTLESEAGCSKRAQASLFSPFFSGKTEKKGPSETMGSCKFAATSQSASLTAPLRGEPFI
ncbi:MAG: hypothetical protein PUK39_04475, partial [Clostridiales bacterium]|nr:hypothetical protein [Clostridiales bacterium]